MANWRKVIVSGSKAELNDISSSGDFVMSKDGAAVKFGNDNEVTLTHVHDNGLLLSDASGIGTTKLNFGDSGTFVQQSADGILNVQADTRVDITGNVSMSANLNVVGNIHAVGDIKFEGGSSGTITMGSGADDNVVFSADVNSHIIPNTDATFDLGSTAQGWNDLHLGSGGVINLDGGDVTLTHSAGKVTLGGDGAVEVDFANHEMTNVDINSGAIDGTIVGAATPAAGTFTAIVGTSLDMNGNVDIDNATTAIDSSGTISIDGGGNVNLDTTSGVVSVGTSTSGIAVSIGHATSEVSIGDNLNVAGNATIAGNLDVNGTLTTIDTTNLQITDAFVQLAKGSTSQTNAGIIANTTADASGSAFYYDGTTNYNRWALTGPGDTGHNQTDVIAPRQYVVSVSASAAPPTGTPGDFGGSAGNSRVGMMYVQTSDDAGTKSVDGDIWIYS
tara:strand:- start:17713 stop:19050 length:1338 start_codon:yes stop_codon:yes gene_type:complete